MLTGKEKLYFLLNRIDDARAIAPSGQSLIIDPLNDLNDNFREVDLSQLFSKLEKDQQVLKVVKVPRRTKTSLDEFDPYDHADDGCWHIEPLPAFDNYFLKVQQEPEYQEFTGKKPPENSTITKKYTRKSLEKIWGILQEIEEKRQLSADNKVGIVQYSYNKSDLVESAVVVEDYQNRKNILEKLVVLGALENLHSVNKGELYWYFFITDKFDGVFKDYEDKYLEVAREYEINKKQPKVDNNLKYEIIYTPDREILLDDRYILAKPIFNSENEAVFNCIYENANRKITREEIEKKTGKKLTKTLPDILDKLGFRGDLKKAFFNVSSDAVEFRNPVSQEILEKLGIKRVKL